MRKRGWNRTEEQGSSLWKDAFLRLSRNRAAMFSLLALALIAAACFLGPLLPWLPHPNVQDLSRIAESPSWDHWFGTDQLGRDLLARVLYGGRISLLVGVVATGVSLVIGVAYGLVSGYAGGRLDALMMRLVDVLFALPFIVLVIIFSLSVEEPARRLTQWVSGMTGWSVEMVSPMTGCEGSQFLMGNADQGRGGPHGGKSGIAFVPGAPVFGYPAGAEFPGGRPAGRPGSQVLQGLMFLSKNHEDCVNDFHAGGLQRFYDMGVVRPSEEGFRGGWQAPADDYPDELGIGVF